MGDHVGDHPVSETIAPSPPPRSAYSVALKKPLDHERKRKRDRREADRKAEDAPVSSDVDRGQLIDAGV